MTQPADLDDDQLDFAFRRLATDRLTANPVRRHVMNGVLDRLLEEKTRRMHQMTA